MRVLITREIPQAGINILNQYKELKLDYLKGPPLTDAKMKKAIKGASAIIPVIPDKITKEVIKEAGKDLKIIATYSVGYDNVDVEFATKKGIYVANTPGDLTEAVAEHAMALMFAVSRRVAEADKYCREGKYKYWDPLIFLGPKLMGKTLGIIGFGRIGQFFSRMAKEGLEMDILYHDIIAHPEGENLLDAKKVDLGYLLENSDVVSIHCNLTDETKYLIGANELKKMKPLAYLINTARGPIINEDALAEALEKGHIAGAGLDVFEEEPKIDSKLKKLNNVVLTPHIGSATLEARIQMARMAAENVVDVLVSKKPPRYIVNKELAKGKEKISSLK